MCVFKVTKNLTFSEISFCLKRKEFCQLSALPSSGKIMRPNMLGPLDNSWFGDKYYISKWRSLLCLWTYLLTYVEHLF